MHMTENNENWILVSQKITQRKRRAKGSENSPQQTNLSWSIHALGSNVALLWAASKMKLRKIIILSSGVPKKKAKKPPGASSLFHLVSGQLQKRYRATSEGQASLFKGTFQGHTQGRPHPFPAGPLDQRIWSLYSLCTVCWSLCATQ